MSRRGSIQVITDYLELMDKEPKDSREAISLSVQYLMVRDRVSVRELAGWIIVTPDHLPSKIRDGRWKFEDIDKMAEMFNVDAADLTCGPKVVRGRAVTRSLRFLMDREAAPLSEVAAHLGISEEGLAFKAIDADWSTGEVSSLATFFGVDESDFLGGPAQIAGDDDHRGDSAE